MSTEWRQQSSAARRSPADPSRRGQQHQSQPCSAGIPRTPKKCVGKTDGLAEEIFDFGLGMASKFDGSHKELHKYVARTLKGGYGAGRAIKDLSAPTYVLPMISGPHPAGHG
uniref:Uncharacterized protein n=1 Tax=Odontella aurita TaxID=265563 RepID=A0A7S4I4Z9_9STRA|mmetsp:Transcript_20060/g.58034  ORF Transcript_20060/g.58034 Transcript_20060/m.58034 type:complete len:112 (+) Transcript_20060:280-615(+)|eukprot:CAMPEP_0113580824 /NCGR_PEP_ID=MMETSP0015_2-20120614/30909_1 /TAXON_ID=2838 /ORGANISM="Odontella" /LENGTH=111 /DNA_ID=CAMNT_0000485099 /DNA_START=126 /DNA_END=461 /DNA_ORIENTATION=+ /assembly_acc=CAM_ASM_000160